ncbi:MAG: hypothetical protein RLZZ127_1543 [Planctomycetota bacterium]|jgi:hypothetical protein
MTMRKRWWILGWVGTALFAAVFAAGMWYRSTEDLDAIAVRMAAMGISEDVLPASTVEDARLQPLLVIERMAEDLHPGTVFPEYDGESEVSRDHQDAMLVVHAGPRISAWRELVDRTQAADPDPALWELLERRPKRMLGVLIRQGDDPLGDLGRLDRLMVAPGEGAGTYALMQAMEDRTCALVAAARVWRRIPAGHPVTVPWRRWAGEPDPDPRALGAAARSLLAASREVAGVTRDRGFFHGQWSSARRAKVRLAFRLGRGEALAMLLDGYGQPASARPVAAIVERVRFAAWDGDLEDPVGFALWREHHVLGRLVETQFRQALTARALLAMIDGTVLPDDPTAAAGGPVRRCEVDGRIAGLYLCGDDGDDDGGDADADDRLLTLDGGWPEPPADP